MDIANNYLGNVIKLFRQYMDLGNRAMDQLEEEKLFVSWNDNSNSIAVIVKHMHGNMLSRWTDFLTTDGEKPWRKRDEEFEEATMNRQQLMALWNEGWHCLFTAINQVNTDQLTQVVYIRNEGQTVLDAINRQLTHYSYHVGQIVFAAKQLKDGEWNSLSIPKRKK